MTERIKALKEYIISKKHHALRTDTLPNTDAYASVAAVDPERGMGLYLREMLRTQTPVFLPGERIAVTRSTAYSRVDVDIPLEGHIPENGWLCNITPDYSYILDKGLISVKGDIEAAKKAHPDRAAYAEVLLGVCDDIMVFAENYRVEAEKRGLCEIAERLSRVPAHAPESYADALQCLRIIHFCLWIGGNHHCTLGRFDQYMYKYLKADMDNGAISRGEALELTEEFFLSCSKDSDLYAGIQQGDNGQSLVVGGCDRDGNDAYNLLSELVLEASAELCVIDPKINLRVDKNTPIERYEYASRLTVKGLGFPQYSNDDVVIPGLIKLGYAPEDARDYVVAACWEFIIPKYGVDVPNIESVSFLDCVDTVIRRRLKHCEDFGTFLCEIDAEIARRCASFEEPLRRVGFRPAPLMSIMMDGCISELRDASCFETGKYHNYGIHGTGVAPAADAIAAVNRLVFNGFTTPEQLVSAMDANFEGYESLRGRILTQLPHMGNNDGEVDYYGEFLLDRFSAALSGLKNSYGGIYRAGTGSAMFYVEHAAKIGATPDGRCAGDYLPANYSPSLGVKLNGPFSIIQSFTKPDLTKTVNGGPLTLEFADSAVKGEEGLKKLAALVRSFIGLGGHQLQLNVINRDSLIDAQKHPERYKNLIVRVWGWSGYFVELDKEFQDHIISRAALSL